MNGQSATLRDIRALTGLRGIAAVDVVLMHVMPDSYKNFQQHFEFGSTSVDIFFCLSGFTLTYVYAAAKLNFRNFFAARIARLYPLSTAAILLAALTYFSAWGGFNDSSPAEIVWEGTKQVLMINEWPIIGSGDQWIAPMWSLSAETFCYAFLFPILYYFSPVTRRQNANRLLIGIILICLSQIAIRNMFSDVFNGDAVIEPMHRAVGLIKPITAIFRAITMFTAGWLACLVYQSHRRSWEWISKGADVAAFAILCVLAFRPYGVDPNLVFLISPFLILSLPNENSIIARLLSSKPVHFLGEISYSIYILHWPINKVFEHYNIEVFHRERDLFYAVVTFAVAIAVSALSYYYFENPARIFLRRALSGDQCTKRAAKTHSFER